MMTTTSEALRRLGGDPKTVTARSYWDAQSGVILHAAVAEVREIAKTAKETQLLLFNDILFRVKPDDSVDQACQRYREKWR